MPESSVVRDRSTRLVVLGGLVVLSGGMFLLLALLHLILPFAQHLSPDADAMSTGWRSALMGLLLHGMIGSVLIGLGVGSMRKRRWVRPMMLMIGWTWLISGLLGTAMIAWMLDDLIGAAVPDADALPPIATSVFAVIMTGFIGAVGVLLPAVFLWGYRDPDVQRTCNAANPEPAWTDGAPGSVLGLSAGLGLAALLCIPLCVQPLVPAFGVLLTGFAGAAATLVFAIALGWLAYAAYRQRASGWWGTTLLMVLVGLSVVITFLRVSPGLVYREMGYSESQLSLVAGSEPTLRAFFVWGSVVITLLSVAYMAAIRKHFRH